jgi:predicted ATPase/DNA-binding winged helix-turn-helix (wHTH) protein
MAGDTIHRFGAFELLSQRQLLFYAGTPVHVGSRALSILTLLVERAGTLVSRDELIAAAWPTTFVDDSNLKVNIAHLRRVLENYDPRQDYIANVPVRGYRFVAPVRREEVETVTFRSMTRHIPLPVASPLIGRAKEIAAVCNGIDESGFLSIVGAGGIGKTSVAIAAAHRLADRFFDGVSFVDLATVNDPQFLASAIASDLGIRSDSEDLLGATIQSVKAQCRLLVLDNCEHLIPSVAAAAERLAAGLPKSRLLITSREPLRLPQERVLRIGPLEVPVNDVEAGDAATVLGFSAVDLFVTRAFEASGYKLVNADFSTVIDICRRLDGIPLAIEIAASRTSAYTPSKLLSLLRNRFDLLDHGTDKMPARHRTLRATLEWSYGLLSAPEAAILRALAVYAGAFTTDDVGVVASAAGVPPGSALECMGSLISKSLLSADSREDALHYRLLDSTRAFAVDRLFEDSHCNRIRQCHAEHICALVERLQCDWENDVTEVWEPNHSGRVADVRRALAWAFGSEGVVALGVRLTVAAIPMWEHFSLLDESIAHLSRALAEVRAAGLDDIGAEVRLQLALASALMYARGLTRQTGGAWDLALALADRSGEVESRLRAHWGRAVYEIHIGRPTDAAHRLHFFGELCQTLSDQSAAPDGERLLAAAEMYLGDLSAAKARLERLSSLYLGNGKRVRYARFQINRAVATRTTLAMLLWLTGKSEAASELVEKTVRDALASGHALSLCNVLALTACPIALWDGRIGDAEHYISLLQEQFKHARLTLWAQLSRCLRGALMIQRGQKDGIDMLEQAIADLLVAGSYIRAPIYMSMLADALSREGRIEEALETIGAALARAAVQHERWCVPELLRVEASIRASQGEATRAEEILQAAFQLADEMGAVAWRLRAAGDLLALRTAIGDDSRAGAAE